MKLTLAFISYAQALSGPTRSSETTFPAMSSTPAAQTTGEFLSSDVMNVDMAYGGLYAIAIGPTGSLIAPTQSIQATVATGSSKNTESGVSVISGADTFWESALTKVGSYATKRTAPNGANQAAKEAQLAGTDAMANVSGKTDVACSEAKVKAAGAYLVCPSIINAALKTADVKQAAVVGRIVWRSGPYSSSATTTEDSLFVEEISAGKKEFYIEHVNTDLILASLYQSNDAGSTPGTPDGTKWCVGAWSNTLSAEVTVKGQKGLGAKTKCTFQFVATSATKAPVFELGGNPAVFTFLVQAVEWSNLAGFSAGTTFNGVKADINSAPWYIGSSATAYDSSHATKTAVVSGGVDGAIFFNPLIKKDATKYGSVAKAYINANNQMTANNKIDNYAPGSLGNAMWYQRPTGLYHDAIHKVDSYYIGQSVSTYNSVSTAFTAAVQKYNTDKKAYEDSVKARKEDSSKELAKRPDMPTPVPAAYSGLSLKLSDQVVPSGGSAPSNWVAIKALTNMAASLDTNGDGTEPSLVKKDSSVNYLSAWEGAAAPAANAAVQAGVGKAFGRLGQGAKTGALATAPKPFIWDSNTTAARPGMMVSIFPKAGDVITATDKFVTIKAKEMAIESVDFWAAPAQPTAASPITDGAKMLISSVMVASAVVSATLM